MSSRTDLKDLACQISQWSQRVMHCEISTNTIIEQLVSPEIISVWEFIINNVGSTTPLNSLLTNVKKITSPPAPELISHNKRISQEEDDLNLEIAILERNIEVHSGIMNNNLKRINTLNFEVCMQPSEIEIVNAYHRLLLKDSEIIKDLISKAETALSELPSSKKTRGVGSQFAGDVQETIQMLSIYYQTTGSASKRAEVQNVHQKLKQIIKLYRSWDFLELLSCKVEMQKLQISEVRSDIPMIKKEMDKAFSQLQAHHKTSFINVQIIKNRIVDLESQKARLFCQLKEQIKAISNSSQIEKNYNTNLKSILKMEMMKHLLEPEAPDGMPSLSIKDLEEIQQQIDIGEETSRNISLQIARISYANRSMIANVYEISKTSNQGNFNILTDKSTHQERSLKRGDIDLDELQELLLTLMMQKDDSSDLCIRTGSKIMNSLVKDNLQTALDIGDYECPTTLSLHLQRKMDDFWCSCGVKRILTILQKQLDLEDIMHKFDNYFRSVFISNSNASIVIEKAVKLSDYITSLLSSKELEYSLYDLKDQTAFDEDIL